MKWIKTFESVSSQKSLSKLSLDILNEISDDICDTLFKLLELPNHEGLHKFALPFFNMKHFKKIEEYDDNFKIFIKGLKQVLFFNKRDYPNGKYDNIGGQYYPNKRQIAIFYTSEITSEIYNIGHRYGKTDISKNLIFNKLKSNFHITLLHELQHAYDDFLSNSKSLYNKQMSKRVDSSIPNHNIINYNKYLKFTHEINSRFAEAVDNITMYNSNEGDDGDGVEFKISFDKYLNKFKKNFHGWDIMKDSVKKRLTIRLHQMWSEGYDRRKKDK